MLDWAREVLADVGLQDGIGLDDVVTFCAGATVVLTFGLLLFRKPLAEFREFMKDWRDFKADWFGTEARDGRSRTPGVMERLDNIDGEFRRNGGKTMKDSQFRTERAVKAINQRLAADDVYRTAILEAAESNMEAIGNVLEAAGHERPAYKPLPPRPAIIEPETEEGPHG